MSRKSKQFAEMVAEMDKTICVMLKMSREAFVASGEKPEDVEVLMRALTEDVQRRRAETIEKARSAMFGPAIIHTRN